MTDNHTSAAFVLLLMFAAYGWLVYTMAKVAF